MYSNISIIYIFSFNDFNKSLVWKDTRTDLGVPNLPKDI